MAAVSTPTTGAALGRYPRLIKNLDVDESADNIVTDECRLHGIYAVNLSSAPLYLKIYDVEDPTVGTTVPVATFPVPSQGDTNGAGFVVDFDEPEFLDALAIAATTGVGDGDTGAPGNNELVVNLRVSGR